MYPLVIEREGEANCASSGPINPSAVAFEGIATIHVTRIEAEGVRNGPNKQ